LLVNAVIDYAIYLLDLQGNVASWNAGAQRIKGYLPEEIIGQHFSRFFTEEDRQADLPARALAVAGKEGRFEIEAWRVRKDGSRFWAVVVIDAVRVSEGNLIGFAKITGDITERRITQEKLRQTQQQLAQSQKMEAVGQLTGGIAHDFNNLLTIIIGNLDTIQRRLGQAGPEAVNLAATLKRPIEMAQQGGHRAAQLTQRLLAFSRKQALEPTRVDCNRLISDMSELFRRTLGETINVEIILAGGLWPTFADVGQLESALLNLAVNARDAMAGGGKLTVETANTYLDSKYTSQFTDVTPGQYVLVSVADTGAGVPPDILDRVSEPFFTTKDRDKGSGLGLAMVHGIVKQSGGTCASTAKRATARRSSFIFLAMCRLSKFRQHPRLRSQAPMHPCVPDPENSFCSSRTTTASGSTRRQYSKISVTESSMRATQLRHLVSSKHPPIPWTCFSQMSCCRGESAAGSSPMRHSNGVQIYPCSSRQAIRRTRSSTTVASIQMSTC
jgi:PAS domain S-box-containing protein